jgi:hypothetical protein
MADFGAFIKADDGSLLVTPDTACYEHVGEYQPSSRAGNVNTYVVPLAEVPLIFVRAGVGAAAGVLSVQASGANWVIEVLSTVSCSILIFKRISGAASGHGMAVFGANGALLFDSSRNVLNVRNAGALSEGQSFAATTGVDSASYTSGPVFPQQSKAQRWELVEVYSYTDYIYSCNLEWVCTPVLQCGFVGDQFVCDYVNSCGFQQVCGFNPVQVVVSVYARVERTTWSISRGTARINSGSISFDWVLHKSGYYDTVLYLTADASNLGAGTLPPGYQPTFGALQSLQFYEGELSANDTFPYTTNRANTGPLTCLTAIRNDYV